MAEINSMSVMEIQAGNPPRLELATRSVPFPNPGDVLIRVAYAGVNRADLLQLQGHYPPPKGASPLPGMEVSGTVAALGAGVTGWVVGQQVCALMAGGGYAQYATAPAAQLCPLPPGIDLKGAASLPEAAATAVMVLECEAKLQPGERVLLHGGTSGVGLLMAQIAKAWGAEVYATVGGPEKQAFLSRFGVHAIDHHAAPFLPQVMAATQNHGVDVVIDTLGGPHVQDHFKLLRPGGRMVTLAMLAGNVTDSLKISGLLMKRLRWSGTTLRSRSPAEKAQIMELVRRRVWPHLASGAIRPVVDSVFPFIHAEKAFARMEERLHMGKILLEVVAEK